MDKIYKDGKGNVIISENLFRKFLSDFKTERFSNYCCEVLNRKIIIERTPDKLGISKRFVNQEGIISWYDGDEITKVMELFKNTKKVKSTDETPLPFSAIEPFAVSEPEGEPWKIEVAFRSEGDYLTISEDSRNNREWSDEEVTRIEEKLNGF